VRVSYTSACHVHVPFIYTGTRLRVHATRATTQRVFITRARVHVWSYGHRSCARTHKDNIFFLATCVHDASREVRILLWALKQCLYDEICTCTHVSTRLISLTRASVRVCVCVSCHLHVIFSARHISACVCVCTCVEGKGR